MQICCEVDEAVGKSTVINTTNVAIAAKRGIVVTNETEDRKLSYLHHHAPRTRKHT